MSDEKCPVYRCPFDGREVRLVSGYCGGPIDAPHSCDDCCCDDALIRAAITHARAIEEAVRPWREMAQEVYDLLEWQTDDSAIVADTSPTDMTAHVNGLCRQKIRALLDKEAK